MSSPKVTYSYANGSANTIRPTSVTYPDNTGGTRVLTYDYGASGGMNDRLSRVDNLGFGYIGSNLVMPQYLGLKSPVMTKYIEPLVQWSLAGIDGSTPYSGLDRFGRVIENVWAQTDQYTALDQIKYGYDRASNRTTRENTVAKAQTTPQYFDELYGYDGSNRLTQMQRGQLAGTTSITNLQFAQDWGLDDTGNWQEFNEDSDGSGTNDLVQARTANPVNEITDITNSVGAPWVQPGYDAAGNMTTIPQGNEPEAGFTGVYDAWNRLVKLLDEDGNMVAEYAYDGLTRRIRKTTAAETRHYFYNASWQILEERVNDATTFDRQYVWGLRYIDELVLRDRQLESSVERHYAIQDANWNVDALVDASGTVVERFSYSAYGVPAFLNPDFTVKAGSDYEWDVLYAGYKWDAESGMYQVRWRYLLPTLGCWGSRDPIGFERGGVDLYVYVRDNPLVRIDFSGLAELKIISMKVGDPINHDFDPKEYKYWVETVALSPKSTRTHTSAKNLAEILSKGLNSDCIKELDIYAHSSYNSMSGINLAFGDIAQMVDTDVRHLASIKFCSQCTIWLDGCNTGLGGESGIAQQVADVTKCTVWGTKGYTEGTHWRGGEKCTKTSGVWPQIGDEAVDASGKLCWKMFTAIGEVKPIMPRIPAIPENTTLPGGLDFRRTLSNPDP